MMMEAGAEKLLNYKIPFSKEMYMKLHNIARDTHMNPHLPLSALGWS
jgi:hypothetical protein